MFDENILTPTHVSVRVEQFVKGKQGKFTN